MSIAWRAGTTADSGGSAATTITLTVPAVQAGDQVLVVAAGLALSSSPPSLSASSTGTQPVSACAPVTGTEALPAALTASLFQFEATGTDAGKIITITAGASAFLSAALGAWSGASGVDVADGAFGGANSATVTSPVLAATAAGDWPVYLAGGASEGSAPNPGLLPPSAGTITSREADISAANMAAVIADIGGAAGGAGSPLGGVTFTAASATNSLLAAFTAGLRPSVAPAAYSPAFVSTDGNGVQTWNGTTSLNQPYTYPTVTPTGIGLRVLPPSAASGSFPHAFLHVLPVNSGYDDTANGNGLDTIRGLGAQNTYNLTVIEHSYGISPWYADNPQDNRAQLESFALQVKSWAATSSFATSGTERHYLIGFSKSGIGGSGLLFRHPSDFAAGAFWDFPATMTAYDGTDPNFGTVGGGSAANYGNNPNFTANYELSSGNLIAWRNASNFATVQRLWVGGHFTFEADNTAYKTLLTTDGILFDGSWDTADASHAWHSDWVAPALASIITAAPAVTTAAPGTIIRPCYCNRDDVKTALDFEITQVDDRRIDRAIQSVAETIEGHLHRFFYPADVTCYLDWPNYQYAVPWRFWFDQPGYHDLWVMTSLQSPSGTAIPLWQVFLEPVNRKMGWPFTRMELDRSTTAAWGSASTPQHSILAAGTWGWYNPQPAGTLAASVQATDTAITVSDGSQAGAGDLLILNPGTGAAPFPAFPGTAGALGALTGERVIVTGKTAASTGLTQSGSGCGTISAADNALATTGSGTLNIGEVVQLDSEQMLITSIVSGVATVKRAWNGTVLAAHSAAAVNAYRVLGVLRGQLGTTAASYSSGIAVSKHWCPNLIRDLAIAESLNRVLQETSGYARTAGSGEAAMPAPGAGLADLWDEAETVYARKGRTRAI